jgi:hypothetical protein
MNRFNLNQLRNDVIDHVDLPASLLNASPSWSRSWIDWILTQMIGSDHYDLMLRHPNMVIVFKSLHGKPTQYLAFNW